MHINIPSKATQAIEVAAVQNITTFIIITPFFVVYEILSSTDIIRKFNYLSIIIVLIAG